MKVRNDALVTVCLCVFLLSCRTSHQSIRDQIPEETLISAQRAGIDYVALYSDAMDGDDQSIEELIRIYGRFDAAAALGHRWVLVQLRDYYGIEYLAHVARRLPSGDYENVDWLLANEPAY